MAIAALSCLGLAGAAQAQQAKEPSETPKDYPAGANRDDTFYFCTACHGFKIVAAQGMTREQWDDTLSWMQDKHNLPVAEGVQRAGMLDYLAAAFPPRPGPRGWKNPFQK